MMAWVIMPEVPGKIHARTNAVNGITFMALHLMCGRP
jgi:hypothetical protein